MADICELAHERTKVECAKRGIVMDTKGDTGEVVYTEEAQSIFDINRDSIESDDERRVEELGAEIEVLWNRLKWSGITNTQRNAISELVEANLEIENKSSKIG